MTFGGPNSRYSFNISFATVYEFLADTVHTQRYLLKISTIDKTYLISDARNEHWKVAHINYINLMLFHYQISFFRNGAMSNFIFVAVYLYHDICNITRYLLVFTAPKVRIKQTRSPNYNKQLSINLPPVYTQDGMFLTTGFCDTVHMEQEGIIMSTLRKHFFLSNICQNRCQLF